jgi:hypothetical protein
MLGDGNFLGTRSLSSTPLLLRQKSPPWTPRKQRQGTEQWLWENFLCSSYCSCHCQPCCCRKTRGREGKMEESENMCQSVEMCRERGDKFIKVLIWASGLIPQLWDLGWFPSLRSLVSTEAKPASGLIICASHLFVLQKIHLSLAVLTMLNCVLWSTWRTWMLGVVLPWINLVQVGHNQWCQIQGSSRNTSYLTVHKAFWPRTFP